MAILAINNNTDKINELISKINSLPVAGSTGGGSAGADGFSPTVAVEETDGGHNIVITDVNGTQTFFVADGATGAKGDTGTGIASITQTTTSTIDGGTNIITATLTDGRTSMFEIKNGSGGSSSSNADTLDNFHAVDFVFDSEFQQYKTSSNTRFEGLESMVGDTSVSKQIETAINSLQDLSNTDILCVSFDFTNNTCSHSASEIIEAADSNKVVTSTFGDYWGQSVAGDKAFFQYMEMNSASMFVADITVNEDKSFTVEEKYNNTICAIYTEDNTASHNSTDINDIINNSNYDIRLYYQGAVFDYQFSDDSGLAYFISNQSNGDVRATLIATIDVDANVSVIPVLEPFIPVPEETDSGKVLIADSDGKVSWENNPGKTLTEHLAQEDMILSSRQYGDKLPGEDGEPYTHVAGRIFFKKVT